MRSKCISLIHSHAHTYMFTRAARIAADRDLIAIKSIVIAFSRRRRDKRVRKIGRRFAHCLVDDDYFQSIFLRTQKDIDRCVVTLHVIITTTMPRDAIVIHWSLTDQILIADLTSITQPSIDWHFDGLMPRFRQRAISRFLGWLSGSLCEWVWSARARMTKGLSSRKFSMR